MTPCLVWTVKSCFVYLLLITMIFIPIVVLSFAGGTLIITNEKKCYKCPKDSHCIDNFPKDGGFVCKFTNGTKYYSQRIIFKNSCLLYLLLIPISVCFVTTVVLSTTIYIIGLIKYRNIKENILINDYD